MANAFDPSRVVGAPPEEILRHRLRRDSESGVHVEGLEDLLVRLASCCTPVPGDPIIGFVTRGRGISVHRNDCANALGLSEEQSARLIDVDWDVDGSQSVVNAGVEVVALDRTNLLRDVANALGDHHVNIVSCETLTGDDRVAKMRFEFELKNVMQLHCSSPDKGDQFGLRRVSHHSRRISRRHLRIDHRRSSLRPVLATCPNSARAQECATSLRLNRSGGDVLLTYLNTPWASLGMTL